MSREGERDEELPAGGRLYEVLDGFVEALLAGEPVDVEVWMQRHPELGDELRKELELVASLHQTAASVALDAKAAPDEDAQPSPAGRAFLEPGTALGDHIVEELLGYGGMGEVYRAHHEHLGKMVAIKVLRPFLADDEDALTRFRDEVKAQASMSPHRNVVTAMHASEHDGRLYLVMEFVDGRDLAKVVRQDGPVSPEQAADYLRQAAEGLAHAHHAGLVHRDVKPSNLLVDEKGTLKVVDLGLARLAIRDDDGDGRTSYIDELVGTLDYVAPEQANDPSAADARSDLYGLGCTLYYLLTGRAPFADRLMLKKLMAHAVDKPAPVEARRDDVPPGLVAILDQLMAKDPADRFTSADALVDALDALGLARARTSRSSRNRTVDAKKRKVSPVAHAGTAEPTRESRESPESPAQNEARDALLGSAIIAAFVLPIALVFFFKCGPDSRGEVPIDAGASVDPGPEASDGDEGPTLFVGQPREAALGGDDERRPKEGSAFHPVAFSVEPETTYAVTLRSSDFDPVLVLRDANGFELVTGHDAPGLGRTAEIIVESRPEAATLTLLATSERATGEGRYLLSARVLDESLLAPGATAEGELTEGDALYYQDDTLCDRYALRVTAGETYVIIIRGETFIPAVFVESADRRRLTQSQQTDVEGEARTVFDAEGDGFVYVIANTSARSDGGAYSLAVETHLSGEQLVSAAGLLAEGDDRARDESYYDAYALNAVDGHTYVITLRSEDFDTYALLVDPETDERIAQNDDAFGTDSRLVWTAHDDRALEVWANSYQPGDTGQYQIEIRELQGVR